MFLKILAFVGILCLSFACPLFAFAIAILLIPQADENGSC